MKLTDLQITIPGSILTGILCLLLSGIGIVASGQVNQQKPDLKFQRIHEGLLSNNIAVIHQDSFGYLWVGTPSGLHRYNGIEFKIYTSSKDTSSLNSNMVESIYEDRNDNLWIGTEGGISRYNRETDNFTRFELENNVPKSISGENRTNTILEDESGTLWISGSGEELYSFDTENQVFTPHGNFSDQQITSITMAENNILWIATLDQGLIKFNTKTGNIDASYTHDPADPNSIASNDINIITMDHDGSLWVGTVGEGLDRMTKDTGKTVFKHYVHQPDDPYSLGNNDVYSLYLDREGRLWIGNENGGLHLYNRQDDSFFLYDSDPNNPYSLSHNSIWSMYEDKDGRFWVGTGLTGLNVADPYASKFVHYSKSNSIADGLNNDIIRTFQELEDGNILVGTDGGGINYFDRKNDIFTAFQHDEKDSGSIGANAVIDISRDPDGNYWVGTWGGSLNFMTDLREGRFVSFQEKTGLNDYVMRNVFDVHFDKEHDYIWIPAFGEALYRYNRSDGSIDIFNPDPDDPNSLLSNRITRIYEDSNNNIWFATNTGASLLKSNDKEKGIFRRYVHSEEDSTTLPGNTVNQFFEDSRNNMWIATVDGLAKYISEDESFQTYRETDGLPSDEIRSIIEDDSGYLWVGTIKGISRFHPAKMTFKNYDKNDGLQGNEFSRYAVHKLSTGELLFGGMNGFNLFHPDSLSDNPHEPPVYFTDFKLFNKSVDIRGEESPLNEHISVAESVTLNHNQSIFTFEFIALNYTKSEQNDYAFKMEGFEEEWNYVGNQRNATYTNLDPGTYTFRVKAANNDGVWNEEGTSLAVVITPPFWQTPWFYLLAALFIGSVIVAGYRYRVRSIKEYSKRLEKEVSDRTSELNNKNRDLEKALEQLEEARDELVEKAHKAGMADLATGVLHNVGNILTSVNTSASLIENTIRESRIERLSEANTILREHIDHIDEFIADNPKGKKLMQYYLRLEEPLKDEQAEILDQSRRLIDKIELINEVIAAQQNYAGASIHAGQTSISKMIDNALALQSGSIERHGLTVEKDLEDVDAIVAQRTKLIHILVNLFKNAKESMADNPPRNKKISIKSWQDEEWVYLSISDNGSGISRNQLDKIFTHGFTTKQSGHGFGLHSSANYMTEMGGKIEVSSDGKGKGATFTLLFPRKQVKKEKNTDTDVDLEYLD